MTSIPPLSSSSKLAPGTAATSNSLSLSTSDFLTLLTAQLKSQDPFNPADPGDTVQQLASLSQVAGIAEIGTTLKQLLAAGKTSIDTASWIGRAALVPSDTALPRADGTYAGKVSFTGVGVTDLSFTDRNGAVVHTERLSASGSGSVDFAWDGLIDGAPAKGPLKVSAGGSASSAGIAIWTRIEGVHTPGQSEAVVETPLGSFDPAAVLDLR